MVCHVIHKQIYIMSTETQHKFTPGLFLHSQAKLNYKYG